MIVVDTNILAYLYLPGDRTEQVEALLEADPEWAAPVLWRSEFRNILAGYIRRKAITFDQACKLQDEAESLLAGAEFEVESSAVLELVRDLPMGFFGFREDDATTGVTIEAMHDAGAREFIPHL